MEDHVTTAATRRGDALGGLIVAVATIQFGFIAVLGKSVLRSGFPVAGLLGFRFTLCALFLAVLLLAFRRPLAPVEGERVGAVVIGVAAYALESLFFFSALRHGTAAAVSLLFFTYPVFVSAISWALGRGRPNRLTVFSLVCAVAGAAVVVGTSGGLDIDAAGVGFALASALGYSVYLIVAPRVLRRTNTLTGAMWVAAAAGISLAIFAFFTGNLVIPDGPGEWWPILGMAIATAGAFVGLLEGLQRIGPVRTAVVSAMEPLSAAVLAYLFLGESVRLGTAVGGLLILVGAIVASVASETKPVEPTVP